LKLIDWVVRVARLIVKGREAGLWNEGQGAQIGQETKVGQKPSEPSAFRRGSFVLLAGLLGGVLACKTIGDAIDRDCRVKRDCDPVTQECADPGDGSFTWTCRPRPTPTPTPRPTPSPSPTPTPRPTPSPSPTPSPRPTPTPTPTPRPTPTPSPSPCTDAPQRICVDNDNRFLGFFDPKATSGPTACWTCKDWLSYMIRGGYFTAGDPKEDGDVGGHPGYWLNYDPQGVLVGLIGKKDCKDPNGRLVVDPPRMVERVMPCPQPTPTPGPSPSPSVPPSPQPGVSCTPLSHVGVAFHAQHPAPNGPLGYRWIFSATPKSRKPFCPDKRNECEQQAYQGDPVNDYDHVTWRFDLRFQCQDPDGPLWNQQEPHTGDSWENTDVRQENAYMANLKPAVRGLHRVRTCRRDAPTVCEITEKVAN
jgi:hypothetical protein